MFSCNYGCLNSIFVSIHGMNALHGVRGGPTRVLGNQGSEGAFDDNGISRYFE